MPRRTAEPESPPNGYRTVSTEDPDAWPLLVAFDLDYTLWDLWIDTHVTPPLRRKGDALNMLHDRRGQDLCFYKEVPDILAELKRRRIHVVACSRTSAPELAREALTMLLLPNDEGGEPIKAISYFNTMEIYPGSKLRHFREVHRKTGIPYDQMPISLIWPRDTIKSPVVVRSRIYGSPPQLFFDDEHRNFEVEELGLTMQLVPPSGTDRKLFEAGLARWRKRRGLRTQSGGT